MDYLVIISGGAGTRLWPLSRKSQPKQLLQIFSEESLLQIAYRRAKAILPTERVYICTGREYQEQVLAQLPDLPRKNLLSEPCGRDSLNAVAWSTAVISSFDANAIIGFLTADQIIEPITDFANTIKAGFSVVSQNPEVFMTFGIIPTRPETGYGYLEIAGSRKGNAYQVSEFKEKPDLDTAQRYLASGNYWWNSGMFIWQADNFLKQLAQLVPDIAVAIQKLVNNPEKIDEIYPQLPRNSVDYAVMEPVSQGKTSATVWALGLDLSWRDVGGFLELAEFFALDDSNNRISGLAVSIDSENNIVISDDGSLTAILGLRDTILVRTSEITMACALSEAQRVKEIVAKLSDIYGDTYK